MQDEGGAKKMNPVLEQHWEKLVLGVVVVLAVVFFATRFSGGGDAAVKSVDRASSTLATKKGQANSKSEAPKPIPSHAIAAPVAANRAPDFTVGYKTKYNYEVIEGPAAVPTKFVFPTVALATPAPKADGVELSWTVNEVKIDPADKSKLVAVPPATFLWKIERQKKGGPWEIRENDLKTDQLKFIDSNTDPKTEYSYRLTLGSNDPAWTRLTPGRYSNTVAGPASVTTPGIWLFDFSNMLSFPDEDPPKPGQVYVTIRKFDKKAGWVEWKKIQYEGELLGVTKEGGVEVSEHRVSSAKLGRTVPVDFKSGARIKKITTEKMVVYDYEECQIKRDENGQPVCEGLKPFKGNYKVDEVIYTDEDGKQQTYAKPPSPPTTGNRCVLHGGAPPPKELSAEEKAAARTKEAETMLDEADKLWATQKAAEQKKAIEIYKRLLENYLNVDAVKVRQGELKDRRNKKFE